MNVTHTYTQLAQFIIKWEKQEGCCPTSPLSGLSSKGNFIHVTVTILSRSRKSKLHLCPALVDSCHDPAWPHPRVLGRTCAHPPPPRIPTPPLGSTDHRTKAKSACPLTEAPLADTCWDPTPRAPVSPRNPPRVPTIFCSEWTNKSAMETNFFVLPGE